MRTRLLPPRRFSTSDAPESDEFSVSLILCRTIRDVVIFLIVSGGLFSNAGFVNAEEPAAPGEPTSVSQESVNPPAEGSTSSETSPPQTPPTTESAPPAQAEPGASESTAAEPPQSKPEAQTEPAASNETATPVDPPVPQPVLTQLTVLPPQVTLTGPRAQQQLVVIGNFSDGSVREVTDNAVVTVSNSQTATRSDTGLIVPVADGASEIVITMDAQTVRIPVTVQRVTDASIHFVNDIEPVLAGCNITGCHGSPKGKNNFQLSLFGAEPDFDFEMVTRHPFSRRINRVEPAKSLLLLKATAAVSHGGGRVIEPGSADYQLLARWIASGAEIGNSQAAKLVDLEVLPAALTLTKNESRQLLVTARFSDGSTRDVTRLATFASNEEPVLSVDRHGKVTANLYGEAVVTVGYGGKFSSSRVTVPQPSDTPFPELTANNRIDELVFAQLRRLGIPPAEVCDDSVFVRRIYLDVIGSLPTPAETAAFVQDTDPQKRDKLIDSLLQRGEFADFWALKWGDLLRVKAEFPIQLWPKGVATFHRWIRDSIAKNKPYDQFVRELITSSGSGYRNGPANYFRATSEENPQGWGEMTATTFLGVRIDCAHCHNHPFEALTWDDNFGLAAFFPVSLKTTGEWGDEIVYFNPGRSVIHERTKQPVKPTFIGGQVCELQPGEDPRGKLSAWMTSPENPWFTKNISNRVWYWLLGRGIIHEPDDLRVTNPPENPELLDYLCQELIAQKYDLKHLFRLILKSKTYQLSSHTNQWNKHDVSHFSHYPIKRLSAEQLLDGISSVCESTEKFPGLPAGFRAIQLPQSGVNSSFLDLFGRPPRDISCECERKEDATMPQALYLINTDHLEGKLKNGQKIKRLIAENKDDVAIVNDLYVAAISRLPTDEERTRMLEYVGNRKDRREAAFQDMLWALLNTKEFMFNH